MKVLNNKKKKRSFSNGLWYRIGVMFPWEKRRYLQIGLFGFVFMFQWGSYQ